MSVEMKAEIKASEQKILDLKDSRSISKRKIKKWTKEFVEMFGREPTAGDLIMKFLYYFILIYMNK